VKYYGSLLVSVLMVWLAAKNEGVDMWIMSGCALVWVVIALMYREIEG